MKEIVMVAYWDSETGKEFSTHADLDDIIKSPSGFKMEHIGLHLLNRERRKLGLAEYKYNVETGTYDEMST